jgi:hypothetical protein
MTKKLLAAFICVHLRLTLLAADPAVIVSHHARSDFDLTADPDSKAWKGVHGVFADRGPHGEAIPGHRTEIRSRWTDGNLYFLFICPYETLNLKPDPVTDAETNHLWDWDVAEVFIGSDFQHIRRYKEFEVSPQGEWVDLDIDRDFVQTDGGVGWNSGFASTARIDRDRKIWYAEMRIPFAAIDKRRPAEGLEYRINLYRCQGAKPDRKLIAWQPTGKATFHVPEAFGRMKLE